jgi:hypothetical protein
MNKVLLDGINFLLLIYETFYCALDWIEMVIRYWDFILFNYFWGVGRVGMFLFYRAIGKPIKFIEKSLIFEHPPRNDFTPKAKQNQKISNILYIQIFAIDLHKFSRSNSSIKIEKRSSSSLFILFISSREVELVRRKIFFFL